jgi:hypothetical protein
MVDRVVELVPTRAIFTRKSPWIMDKGLNIRRGFGFEAENQILKSVLRNEP